MIKGVRDLLLGKLCRPHVHTRKQRTFTLYPRTEVEIKDQPRRMLTLVMQWKIVSPKKDNAACALCNRHNIFLSERSESH